MGPPFNASADKLGKNIGDDLAEGKATLPLIYAMQQGSADEKEVIRNAILEGGLGQLEKITAIIESTGALQYTAARAQEAADTAIAATSGHLSPSPIFPSSVVPEHVRFSYSRAQRGCCF